jgi:hypothetical protein
VARAEALESHSNSRRERLAIPDGIVQIAEAS